MNFNLIDFRNYPKEDDVYILSNINNEFANCYLKLRKKEKRIYSDEEVKKLPFASQSNPHIKEWNSRAKSFIRFKKYLNKKNQNLSVLDLGCGNGWFSGQLSKDFLHNFFCVDVNLTELKQGARLFGSDRLQFIYVNVMSTEISLPFFDLIIMNSAIQYFPDFNKIINKLLDFLNHDGEVHIIDSPIYNSDKLSRAKESTASYFLSISFPEMIGLYHHHTYDELKSFNHNLLYDPSSMINSIKKVVGIKDSPFPWIIIKK